MTDGGGDVAELRGEVARLRAEVARVARRVDAMTGEVRAAARQAQRAAIGPHQVVRRAEAAALVDVSPATLAAWARDGRGPPFHLRGNRAWYRVADLAAWRDAAEREALASPCLPGIDAARAS